MARGEYRRNVDEGRISQRELGRAMGGRYAGLCGPDEINDQAYQRDAATATGFGAPKDYGPADLGHIDSKANRRKFPKESTVRASNRIGTSSPRAAPMQRSYDVYDTPGRN